MGAGLAALSAAAAFAVAAPDAPVLAWHVTDSHLDPYYEEGIPLGAGCYCESHAACARMPAACVPRVTGGAGPFGEPQDNCATPVALWSAAVEFMASTAPGVRLVFHTGDFSEAGAAAACSSSSPAQAQVLSLVNRSMSSLRAAFPNAAVFSVVANHDTVPGDVVDAGPAQAC